MNNDSATAIMIGALLLAAIIAAGFGLVVVILTSEPPPIERSAGDFELKIDPQGPDAKVFITHMRGDKFQVFKDGTSPQQFMAFRILVNGEEWPIDNSGLPGTFTLHKAQLGYGFDDFFAPGDTLEAIYGEKKPEIVTFIEKKPDGSEYVLWGIGKEQGAIQVDFYAQPRVACVGESIWFYDASTNNPQTWLWNFGDGTTSTEQNPTHSYNAIGQYTVTLTAGDPAITEVKTNYISIQPIVPDFSGTPLFGIEPLDVQFTDLSRCGEGTSFYWIFGDKDNGVPQTSMDRHPLHTYYAENDKVTRYTVTFRVTQSDVEYPVSKINYVTVCPILVPDFLADPITGRAPLPVQFTDYSTGDPNRWKWDFGDGTTSNLQNPQHTFTQPGQYTINLTVSNLCESKSISKSMWITVDSDCENMYADFTWDMPIDTEPYTVQFRSPLQNCGSEDCAYDIRDWEWDFGDGTGNNSGIREPLHVFPLGYDPTGTIVTLTVKNYVDSVCNQEDTISKQLNFNCPALYPSFTAEPNNGPPGIEVTFTDTSTPQDDIVKWRWIFGDASKPYESSDPDNHTPPPHTYQDTVPRIYTVVLQIQNSCGQTFSTSREIAVTADASISGHLWDDKNVDGIEDPAEPALQGWRVDLEKRDGSNWIYQDTRLTDASGNYQFNPMVATAVFRIKINYPSGQIWKTTYSYRSDSEKISGILSIGADRTINGVNFGNARWKTSSLEIPGYMIRYNQAGNYIDYWYYRVLSNVAEYFEFTTTFSPDVWIVYMNPINSNSGIFSIPPYSSWGNSEFTIFPREYNTYLKTTYNGQSGAFYLRYWEWNGIDYYGIPFTVPDDTLIDASELRLKYYWDPSVYFKFDKPTDGETIPYSNSYRIEVHYQGPYEDTSNCYIISPVSSAQRLSYNSTIGEYVRNIDVRGWEGTTQTFTARMRLTNRTYVYTSVTATIGWEPIIPAITNVQSEVVKPQIRGITTVTGTVTGKWRDNANVSLIVNNQETIPMSFISQTSTSSTFRAEFNAEPYAGKVIPLKIKATPVTGHGNMVESAEYAVTARSKLSLKANFSADPWTGPVPIWIAFTDTSQGGANSWSWDFRDGNTSSVQNPVKSYFTPGNYSVTLQVTNITGATSTISKWVNLTGKWHKVEVNSNRYSYLKSGGEIRWIATVDNSMITVNNRVYPVMAEDTIRLVLLSDLTNTEDNRIELGGGITACNLSNVSFFLNEELTDNGACTDILMSDYLNFHSNLQLVAEKNSVKYALMKWDENDWKTISKLRDLNVYELMPDWNKTMSLYLTDGFTTFDGWASDYTPK